MNAPANPAQLAAPVVKCGGCFKPVDPETSTKRTIYPRTSTRYGRFSQGSAERRIEHFCNEACVDRARADSR
jgi:hypothetical protein